MNLLHGIHLILVFAKAMSEWLVLLEQHACWVWRISAISYYASYLFAQYIIVLKTRKLFNLSNKMCSFTYACMLIKMAAGIVQTVLFPTDTLGDSSCVANLEPYSFKVATTAEILTSGSILVLTLIGYRANPALRINGLYNALSASNLVGVTFASMANIALIAVIITLKDPLDMLITMHVDFLVFTIAVSWLITEDIQAIRNHQSSSINASSGGPDSKLVIVGELKA